MKIILREDWMGRKKGSELNITDAMARTLVKRGTAKPAEIDFNTSFRDTASDRMVQGSPKMKKK